MKKDNFIEPTLSAEVKKETRIIVSMPDEVEIKFVPAAELRHYEITLWLGSLFSSATVGFWTAYLTTAKSQILFWVGLVFSIFTLAFVGVALYYRSKLKSDGLKRTASLSDFK